MSDLLDMAEKAGFENMRERIEVAGMIQREANTATTVFLAGAGAALAYAAKDGGADAGFTGAAIAVCLYLFALVAILNWKCLGLIAYPACCNEPANLYKAEYRLDQIRRWELENLQTRIMQALSINEQRSIWLNRCRYAATITPLVAFVGWGVAYLAVGDAHAVAVQAGVWGFLAGVHA